MGTKKEFIRRSVKNIYLYKHHQLCRKQPHVFLKDVAAAVHIMHTELQTNSTAPVWPPAQGTGAKAHLHRPDVRPASSAAWG